MQKKGSIYNFFAMFSSNQLLDQVNSYISSQQFNTSPKALYAPIEYILSLGGKRIRPVLMLMAYNLYRDNVSDIMPQAMAIETYHNFTLLHDDLMDNADVRRNKPTVHKVWNDNTAILSGDAMLILAYKFFADCVSLRFKDALDQFNTVTLEICEGQQFDMEFEGRLDVTEAEYLEMIRLKTAVLLAASLKIGAILGGASDEDANHLYDFGIQIGIAFQLKDDFLDVYGDPVVFGKNIGGDILCNKKTYMLIKALENADAAQRKELEAWIVKKEYNPLKKISAVTELYNQIGIKAICEKKMYEFYSKGLDRLLKMDVDKDRLQVLKEFAEQLMYREL